MKRIAFTLLTIHCLFNFQFLFSEDAKKYEDEPYSPRPAYGAFVGVNINTHSTNFAGLPGIPSCCPRYETGSGVGATFGGFYLLPLSESLDLNVRAGFFMLNGLLSRTENAGDGIYLPDQNGNGVEGEFEHSVDASIASAGLQPMLGFDLTDELKLYAGMRAAFVLTKSYEQKEEIVTPEYGAFLDEAGNWSRTRFNYSGDIPDASALDLALVFGAGYDLPLNSDHTTFLSPEAFIGYGLTSVAADMEWNVMTFSAGISLKFAPRKRYIPPSPPPAPAPYPEIPPPDPPVLPTLDATINAVAVEKNGSESPVTSIKVEEFKTSHLYPLLNYVFFNENSSAIPSRYTTMSDDKKAEFDVSRFVKTSTMEVYRNILNIIGKRMFNFPQANITLTGCNSNSGAEAGNTDLSRARAEAVRDFLVSEWGIDPSRISVKSRNLPAIPSNPNTAEGKQENRRVEIVSDNPMITEPIFSRTIVRKTDPPKVRFKVQLNDNLKIKNWRVMTSQSKGKLRVFHGTGAPPNTIDWDLEKENQYMPIYNEPLRYKLEIVDVDDRKWVSREQSLPVQQVTVEKKEKEHISDTQIDKFSLILFDFDSSTLNEGNQSIANFAKDRIKENSTVSVTGYTDRVGDASHNMKLSLERAKATAKSIGVDESVARGEGEENLLYDNSLPEGRFYCRTVTIEIITSTE